MTNWSNREEYRIMPNQTFYNLPQQKQNEIIRVSLEEFIGKDYESASLNHIIDGLGIAKGSFYRYFSSKRDLYIFLIDDSITKAIEFIKEETSLQDSEEDFFSLYKSRFYAFIEFIILHPNRMRLLFRAYEGDTIKNDVDFSNLRRAQKVFLTYIVEGQERGQLKLSLDPDLIFYVIAQLTVGLNKFIEDKYGLTYDEFISNEPDVIDLRKEQLDKIFQQIVSILRTGLG